MILNPQETAMRLVERIGYPDTAALMTRVQRVTKAIEDRQAIGRSTDQVELLDELVSPWTSELWAEFVELELYRILLAEEYFAELHMDVAVREIITRFYSAIISQCLGGENLE